MIYGDLTQRIGASQRALPVTANGDILISMDAGQKSRLLRGSDHATRWEMMTSPKNEIVGMHAAVAECQDGSLLVMSRDYGQIYGGKMPWNRSADGGKTWQSGPSDLPAISVGQMPLLLRLREGPLLLVSFTDDYINASQRPITGLLTKDAEGHARRIFGAYTARSYDDGKTSQKLKPLTSVRHREWTMDAVHGTPAGYFSGAQSPDGIIHLADSRYYQRLYLAWLEQPMPPASAEEKASEAKTEQQIQEKGSFGIPARGKGARLDFDAGNKGK